MAKKMLILGLAVLFCAGIYLPSFAQEAKTEKPKPVGEAKTLEGEVSAVSKNGIAVVYNRNPAKGSEDEVFVPLDSSVRIVHKNSISDINVGDVVSIQYEEVIGAEKDAKRALKAVAVTFVKPAVKKPEVPETAPAEEQNESQGALPLKGIK